MPARTTKDERPRLSPERQELVDEILRNLEEGAGLWVRGWSSAAPASLATGRAYRGVNNLYLSYVSGKRGYDDNRWVTFSQMERNGWTFKRDGNGNTMGSGASVPVEFYEFRDRATRAPYDRASTDGMTEAEREEYLRKNVYPVKKTYRVFNASLVDGVPERSAPVPAGERNGRIERLISYWDAHESKITCGGNVASYSPASDEIQLPPRAAFHSLREYYSTALHEMGHATGHASRLDRNLDAALRNPHGYAMEELRAELGSVFMEQDFAPDREMPHVRNNAAYIGYWIKALKDDPDAFFSAVADAERMARYVSDRSLEAEREYRGEKDVEKDGGKDPGPGGAFGKAAPETLRLSDRDLLERCMGTRTGDTFRSLYEGSSGFPADKACEFLSMRLAVYSSDPGQIGRVMRSSACADEWDDETLESTVRRSLDTVNALKDRHGERSASRGKDKARDASRGGM